MTRLKLFRHRLREKITFFSMKFPIFQKLLSLLSDNTSSWTISKYTGTIENQTEKRQKNMFMHDTIIPFKALETITIENHLFENLFRSTWIHRKCWVSKEVLFCNQIRNYSWTLPWLTIPGTKSHGININYRLFWTIFTDGFMECLYRSVYDWSCCPRTQQTK